ncbi:MAG TPA: TlpA disulfide reductase family protein [Anaeromyxobacteraceae bacterium]|nr:TlpA disulfide reductase family protein [Anaeromyxobacteraceae bacterium]
MRPWLKLALLALAAVVVTQVLVQKAGKPLAPGAPPPPLALPDVQGRPVDLAALRGKVVAVNFWATWCAPCRQELPELAEAWAANHDRCFELLGVVEESAREDVEAAARRIPYPVLVDQRAEAAAAWRVTAYPRTYLVDAEGTVRRVFDGAVSRRELEAAMAPLLPASCGR